MRPSWNLSAGTPPGPGSPSPPAATPAPTPPGRRSATRTRGSWRKPVSPGTTGIPTGTTPSTQQTSQKPKLFKLLPLVSAGPGHLPGAAADRGHGRPDAGSPALAGRGGLGLRGPWGSRAQGGGHDGLQRVQQGGAGYSGPVLREQPVPGPVPVGEQQRVGLRGGALAHGAVQQPQAPVHVPQLRPGEEAGEPRAEVPVTGAGRAVRGAGTSRGQHLVDRARWTCEHPGAGRP